MENFSRKHFIHKVTKKRFSHEHVHIYFFHLFTDVKEKKELGHPDYPDKTFFSPQDQKS